MNKAFSVLFIIAYRSCTRAGYPVFLHRPFAFRTQNFFARLGTFFVSCLPFFAVPVSPCFCTGRLSSAIFCTQNFLPIWDHFSFLACHFLLSRYPRVFQSAVCLQLSSERKIFCPFGTIFRFLPAIFLLSGCRFFVCQNFSVYTGAFSISLSANLLFCTGRLSANFFIRSNRSAFIQFDRKTVGILEKGEFFICKRVNADVFYLNAHFFKPLFIRFYIVRFKCKMPQARSFRK